MPAHHSEVAAERCWRESLECSRSRRFAASRRRRWRGRGRGLLVASAVATSALGGVALASTGGAHAHQARHAITTLHPGSHGSAVSTLQRALGIPATGYYDSATVRAVRRFQQQNGLTVDGIAGPQTLKALGLGYLLRGASHSRFSGNVKAELAKIARCESGDDPHQVSPDGRYRGKYQFDMQTWRALGGRGDPARAPEDVQDRLAAKLLRERGKAPWPNCA
jgi:hypothetical protein